LRYNQIRIALFDHKQASALVCFAAATGAKIKNKEDF
jgi:hypothetical protein